MARPVYNSQRVRVGYRLPLDIAERLNAYCNQRALSLTSVVEDAIIEHLDIMEGKKAKPVDSLTVFS